MQFFADKSLQKNKCKELSAKNELALEWEQEKVSIFSCSPVLDGEVLARHIFSPIHIDKDTSELTTAAFDDIFNKGLSVQRIQCLGANKQKVHKFGNAKVKKDIRHGKSDRRYEGYAEINSSSVRSPFGAYNERYLAIYDSALFHSVCHADICCIKKTDKASKLIVRKYIADIFSKLIRQ